MWRSTLYIARAGTIWRSCGWNFRLFFWDFFVKSRMWTSVLGIWSGNFLLQIICDTVFKQKKFGARHISWWCTRKLQKLNLFLDFPFFQFWNYHICSASIRILLRPGNVGQICMGYGSHKPIKPIWFKIVFIAIET